MIFIFDFHQYYRFSVLVSPQLESNNVQAFVCLVLRQFPSRTQEILEHFSIFALYLSVCRSLRFFIFFES
ncbi:hypothetical protein AYI68_g4801 [Smittium mucronatum]|uniref:Uncharacterized protein n=1 Tax=Smittium mucronatum TaxID=133383 RepID=A0A1R0GW13_9FUNG|nr:hypothetical protein AYI68_g4801 [Smittium mucronatum]